MIKRVIENKFLKLFKSFPCVALIGPRQVGKTTLVKEIQKQIKSDSIYLDLELTSDFNKLLDAETFLSQNISKTIIIDEVQRKKDLFPLLRALIDKNKKKAKLILLGSASPDLLRDSSETLAGRIAYLELTPFVIPEIINKYSIERLWIQGGFPDAFLQKDIWEEWMRNFVSTYLEKDLPQLGFSADRLTAQRLWTMIAHNHGSLINYSEFSKSLEISVPTVKKYINFLESAFLVRQLESYHFNIKKRVVKSPKIYIRDSGILHYLLGLHNLNEILGYPKMGSSWEGFIIEQIQALLPKHLHIYFYRTSDGSELDLVIEKGGHPYVGIEIKYGSNVRPVKGNTEAIKALKTKHNFVIIKNDEDYLLSNGFRVCGINFFIKQYLPSF